MPSSPLALAQRVDAACARFEAAWQSGGRPRLEDYLGATTEPERTAVLRELLRLEVEYRLRRGETPRPEEYRDRFPGLDPDWLADAFGDDRANPLPTGPWQPTASTPADGASLPPVPEAVWQELRLPGYEVLGELGRGGMAVVYKARQIRLSRLVAVKMILAGGHAGPEQLARFQAEAEAVARLQHPHIVQVYEVGALQGRPFFTLEFCPGGSLAERFGGQPQAARAAAELVRALAGAVQHAHACGIVHRDLKPANVLVAADGTPKVRVGCPGGRTTGPCGCGAARTAAHRPPGRRSIPPGRRGV
jgi:hypothetical protein